MKKKIPNSDFIIDINGNLFNTKTKRYRIWVKHPRTKMLINCIIINGSRTTIHQHKIMAEYFVPNPDNKKYIQHINGNILDNRVENLQWVDNTLSQQKAYKKAKSFAKKNIYTYKQVIDIKNNKVYRSISEASKKINISRTYLSNMLNGIVPNHTTLKFI